jgi:hypothetical protein
MGMSGHIITIIMANSLNMGLPNPDMFLGCDLSASPYERGY